MRRPRAFVVWLVAFASLHPPLVPAAQDSGERVVAPSRSVLYPILARGRWGFIDRSGRIVVPPRFESILAEGSSGAGRADERFLAGSVEAETTAVVAVRSGGSWGFVDHDGRLLPPRFDQVSAFREGLAAVRQGTLWGFANGAGVLAVQPRFEQAGSFLGGVAIVSQGYRYGAIDPEGRFVVRPRFELIRPGDSVFHDNRALVTMNGKKGYVSRSGSVAVPAMFDDAAPFSEGLAAVTRGGRTGYIDTTGRMAIAPRAWTAGRFSRGRATVMLLSGQIGYIDRSGAYVAEPQFTDARAFDSDDRAQAWKGPTMGWVDLSGRWRSSRIEERQRIDDSLSVAVVAGRNGLVNRRSGEMVREYPWEEVGPFREGLAAVRDSNGRVGFVDLEGRLAIPARFRQAGYFDHGLCKAATRDTLGYVDRRGAWVWSSRFR